MFKKILLVGILIFIWIEYSFEIMFVSYLIGLIASTLLIIILIKTTNNFHNYLYEELNDFLHDNTLIFSFDNIFEGFDEDDIPAEILKYAIAERITLSFLGIFVILKDFYKYKTQKIDE